MPKSPLYSSNEGKKKTNIRHMTLKNCIDFIQFQKKWKKKKKKQFFWRIELITKRIILCHARLWSIALSTYKRWKIKKKTKARIVVTTYRTSTYYKLNWSLCRLASGTSCKRTFVEIDTYIERAREQVGWWHCSTLIEISG